MSVPINLDGCAANWGRESCPCTWASDECPHKPGWVRDSREPMGLSDETDDQRVRTGPCTSWGTGRLQHLLECFLGNEGLYLLEYF